MSLYHFQQRVNDIALDMMLRGVAVNLDTRKACEAEVVEAMAARKAILEQALGHPVKETFFRSAKQVRELFASLGQRPGTNRKSGKDAFDDETLFRIAKRTPGLQNVCFAIIEYRSLGNMLSNFIRAQIDPDGRLRCSFNTAGPETFRWSSSRNAFYRGCNLQNVTTGDRGLTAAKLPNLRRVIVPDPGHVLWEPDLAGADAQVVAWDANDPLLKQMFREGVKIHAVTAKEIYGGAAGPDGKREPYYTMAKKGRHLSHYGGKARTMAASLGITVAEAERLQARLWAMHPAIPRWHKRIAATLAAPGHMIANKFGYRIVYFDRPEDVLPDALAWIGQGTVACIINRALVNIVDNVPGAVPLLQEHDSIVGQTPVEDWTAVKSMIREQFLRVVVPYDDPLVVPPEIKTSLVSWGDMEKEPW